MFFSLSGGFRREVEIRHQYREEGIQAIPHHSGVSCSCYLTSTNHFPRYPIPFDLYAAFVNGVDSASRFTRVGGDRGHSGRVGPASDRFSIVLSAEHCIVQHMPMRRF